MSSLNCVESCLTCNLRMRSFFCHLSQSSVAAVHHIEHAAVFPEHSPEHSVVLVEGQKAWGVSILCRGRAKLSTTSQEGETLMVRIAEAGEVLGLHAVITGGPYQLTVATMEPCQLDFVGKDDSCVLSESMRTRRFTRLSTWREIVLPFMGWCTPLGCRTRFRRGSRESSLKPQLMGRAATGPSASGWHSLTKRFPKRVGTSRETIMRLLCRCSGESRWRS
jgi:hypothetical protein